MKIAELFVALGFKGDKEMLKSLETLKQKTMHYSNQISSAVKALNAMTEAAREHAFSMDLYEKTTGKSADELQNLSYQAAQFNVTQDELASTLKNIQQITTDVRLGKGMPSAFTLLGIDPNQDPVQIISKVQQAIKTLDAPTALNIARELGIDDKMFYMLKMTSKNMENLNKQYRITAQERSNLVKLNAEWQKFWFLLKQITTKFQAATAALQSDFIKRFLEMANRLADMVSGFLKAVQASKALKTAVIALGLVLTAVFAPWLLILGAVFLVLEDIWTFFEGGDSITGDIVKWAQESEKLKDIFEILKILFDTIKGTVKEIVGYLKEAKEHWDETGGKLSKGWNIAKDTAIGTWDSLKDMVGAGLDSVANLARVQNNTINNQFISNEAPTKETIVEASSDAIYQLQEAN